MQASNATITHMQHPNSDNIFNARFFPTQGHAQVVLISQCRIVDIICEWERKELPFKNKIDHRVAELTCGAFTKSPTNNFTTNNFRSCAYPCPGAASLLLYAETAGAVVVAGNLVYYLICLTPRSVPRLPISPQQQKLLGLSNADLGETITFYSGLFKYSVSYYTARQYLQRITVI